MVRPMKKLFRSIWQFINRGPIKAAHLTSSEATTLEASMSAESYVQETEQSNLLSSAEPVVTLVASAIRTEFWLKLYWFLSNTNETPFRMVFVGHVNPDFDLPANFTYLHSTLPPAPCVELAYRAAHVTGSKYVMNITDDCLLPVGVIDKLVAAYEACDEEHALLSPSFCPDPNSPPMPLRYHTNDESSPALPVFGFMSVATSKAIAGIDRRFKAICWDCDRALRVYEIGGTVKVLGDVVTAERENRPDGSGRLYFKYVNHDRPLLDRLWTSDRKGGPVSSKRLESVMEWPVDLN